MAKVDAGKIKEDAGKYLRRGKLDKALEAYLQLEKAEPNDLRVPQKIAELMLTLGQKDQAIAKYYESAEKYRAKGFLVQAIAIYKVILVNAPQDTKAADILKQLTDERSAPVPGLKSPAGGGPAAPAGGKALTTAEILNLARKKPAADAGAPKAAPPIAGSTSARGMGEAQAASQDPVPAETEEPVAVEPEEAEAMLVGGDEIDLAGEPAAEGSIDLAEESVEMEVEVGEPEVEVESTEFAEATSIDVVPLDEEEELPEHGPDRTPLFSDLSAGEFDRVFEFLQSKVVDPGTVIVTEGENGDSIYIIARGQARVSRADEEGADREVATLGPGDFFGEIGYFMGERRATVTALKKTQLLEMAKADLDQVVTEFPRVQEVLVKFYRERVLENLLSDSPLFKELLVSELHTFRDAFVWHELKPGAVIVKEGAPGDSMFLIKAGEVKVQTAHPISGEVVELARLKGGDFFGEVSLIKNKPRTASVVAVGKAEVMELSRDNFQKIASAHPHLGSALEQTIEQRVENTIKKMMEKM